MLLATPARMPGVAGGIDVVTGGAVTGSRTPPRAPSPRAPKKHLGEASGAVCGGAPVDHGPPRGAASRLVRHPYAVGTREVYRRKARDCP
jgi:hypothetical protein